MKAVPAALAMALGMTAMMQAAAAAEDLRRGETLLARNADALAKKFKS